MNGQQIIDLFDVLTDGLSELSADNKLALANRKYKALARKRSWYWLLTSASATVSSGEVALESDFRKLAPNVYGQDMDGYKHIFFQGTTPYPIIGFAERMRFNTLSYHDVANSKLVIQNTSLEGQTITYDYIKDVTALTTATSPVIPESDYHEVIAYEMAIEHYSIDQTESGRNKVEEYQGVVDGYYEDMEYDDAEYWEKSANYA